MGDMDELQVDAVLEEASRRTGGLTDLGDGPFAEPLGLFLDSLRTRPSSTRSAA